MLFHSAIYRILRCTHGCMGTTVCPKANPFDVGRKLLDKPLNKINRLVAAVMPTTAKHPPNVIPGPSHKTQQRMIALSSLLLGIISHSSPLLIAINRNHMRVQVKGNTDKLLKTPSCLDTTTLTELRNQLMVD